MKPKPIPRIVTLSILVAAQAMAIFALAAYLGRGAVSREAAIAASLALAAIVAVQSSLIAVSHRAADRRARKHQLLGELASEVNRAILLNEDEGKVFSNVLDYAFRVLEHVNLGSILAFGETGELVIVASQGFSEDFVRGFRLRLEDSFQYRQSGGNISEAMIIDPVTIRGYADRLDSSDREYKSIISAPLFVGGELYGFLNVDSVRANSFGPDDLGLLKKFGAQIEVCLLARKRYRASIEESRVDGLTGFLSRSHFERLFEHSIDHAERYGGKFALGMFDLDGLKRVNDALGHPAGDLFLKATAEAIRRTARKSDAIGRYGGDEFIGIFYNSDSGTMAERSAAMLEEMRASPPEFAGRALPASFSFGFADYPADARDLAALIAAADARLYAMKARRRARKGPRE